MVVLIHPSLFFKHSYDFLRLKRPSHQFRLFLELDFEVLIRRFFVEVRVNLTQDILILDHISRAQKTYLLRDTGFVFLFLTVFLEESVPPLLTDVLNDVIDALPFRLYFVLVVIPQLHLPPIPQFRSHLMGLNHRHFEILKGWRLIVDLICYHFGGLFLLENAFDFTEQGFLSLLLGLLLIGMTIFQVFKKLKSPSWVLNEDAVFNVV